MFTTPYLMRTPFPQILSYIIRDRLCNECFKADHSNQLPRNLLKKPQELPLIVYAQIIFRCFYIV